MKHIFSILIVISAQFPTQGQIQIRPLPEMGFENRIREFVNNLELVDTHNHLSSMEALKNHSTLDFMLLLHHYMDDDIKSAGMSKPQFAELLTDKYSVKEKWKIVEPYWEVSKNTAYGRVVLLTIDELYGIKELNGDTVVELSEQIRKSYDDASWYDYVLKERAKIKYIIMDVGSQRMEDDMFVHVEKFDRFIRIHSKGDLLSIGGDYNTDIATLDSFVIALEKAFQQAMDRDMIGVKSALAYHRPLNYENVPKEKAEHVFNQIMNGPSDKTFDFDQVKSLQDYMMHRIIGLARKYDIPMQIHTGLQAGDGNYISNSNPALLTNLFLEYRDVRFSIFHGSYPYGGELSALAKNFRNVFLDMSWLYIISPSYSERYLHEWLETVPSNKIMAFGGDYHNVENILGHSLMARMVVSKVLIEKVKTGYLTEEEAKQIAERLLYKNALELFNIE